MGVANDIDKPAKLRSPLMRAVLPNVGGLIVLGLIGLMLWGFAAYISRGDAPTSDRLPPAHPRGGGGAPRPAMPCTCRSATCATPSSACWGARDETSGRPLPDGG